MPQTELNNLTLSQLLTGIFEPTIQTELYGDSTFREIASEGIIDGNPDNIVMPAILSMIYDTVKELKPLNHDFDGFRFYNIDKRNVRDNIVSQIKARQLCLGKVDFNDAVDPLFAIFSQLHKNKGSKKERAWYRMLAEAIGNFRIACLCNQYDMRGRDSVENLLMWAHYANSHKGICVKYHIPKRCTYIDDSKRRICVLKQVNYKDKIMNVDDVTLEDAFFLKSKQWSYEYEHRLLYFSESTPVNYYPITGIGIDGIYLGARITAEDRRYILNEMKGSEIPVFQMKFNRENVLRISPQKIYN